MPPGSVRIGPGAMELTRMPRSPNSLALQRVSSSSPPLTAA
ncbi:hypothetical protein A6302_02046 [Methylobrevis pamukkalensis]|uniref:Uncharacterized protein n=1 Tax=Methylobrevis pamukkalensis TaxID=1439726 RepID=A0A1E3H2W2_9HYPH|nr:hypothetical protein A6302_02046 [Methylobrevis pamukkalensis]